VQSFVVSARKYRPSSWQDVIGQDQVVTTLKNAIRNDHLAQSFLFCGPRGVGKTTCARILAKTINCENISASGEACNVCESCRSFADNASFNIHELDGASNNSVDDIRNLVDQVRYAPASGKFKIYIIDEVHMLSNQAFNAFLKTLEEPPAFVKFILATTEKHKIIPTILSRCQIFDFNRIRIRDMVKQLEIICRNEHIVASEEAMHLIAQRADGAMRDALSIFDRITSFSGENISAKDVIENLNILDYEYFFRITDAAVAEDSTSALVLFDEVINKGFEGDAFMSGLADHFRNLLMCKDPATLNLLDTSEAAVERYKLQSELVPASFLLTGLNLVNTAELQYRLTKNKRLHVELFLMKLCYMHRAVSGRTTATEKKTADLNEVPPDAIPLKQSTTKKTDEIPVVLSGDTVREIKKVQVENTAVLQGNPEELETIRIPKKTDLRNAIQTKEEQDRNAEPEPEEIADAFVITPERFFVAWKQYANHIRPDQQSAAIVMDHATISIDKGNMVTIHLETPVEVSLMKGIQSEMQSFLRESLEINRIDISFAVTEKNETRSKRPYTQQEKFKKMEELNPLLRELRDKLGFEIDY